MKKAFVLCVIISMMCSMIAFADETESFFPTYEQTASAYLDQSGKAVKVTVDLTGGWSVEFAPGAVYLYEGNTDGEAAEILRRVLGQKKKQTAFKTLKEGDELRVLTWNIGYGALGDNADFFMDGGKMVNTADKDRVASSPNSSQFHRILMINLKKFGGTGGSLAWNCH